MIANALDLGYEESFKTGAPMRLRVFVSGRGRLENQGAIGLAAVFEKMRSLEEISMPQNGIYPPGICALAKGLGKNPNLRILDLMDNTANPKGAKAIANELIQWKKLEVLNLSDCLLKGSGTRALIDAIIGSGNDTLRQLYLSGNQIPGDLGLDLVSEMENIPSLQRLSLSNNNFGDTFDDIQNAMNSLDIEINLSDDEGSLDSEDIEEDFDPGEDDEANWTDEDEDEGEDGDFTSPMIRNTGAPPVTITTSPLASGASPLLKNGYGNHTTDETSEWNEGAESEIIVWESQWEKEREARVSSGTHRDYGADADMVARDFLKLCESVTRTNESRILEDTKRISEKLLVRGIEMVNKPTRIINYIMERLGLIKNEEGKTVRPENPFGCIKVLAYIVRRPWFAQPWRDIVGFMLERSNAQLFNGIEDVKMELEQALTS